MFIKTPTATPQCSEVLTRGWLAGPQPCIAQNLGNNGERINTQPSGNGQPRCGPGLPTRRPDFFCLGERPADSQITASRARGSRTEPGPPGPSINRSSEVGSTSGQTKLEIRFFRCSFGRNAALNHRQVG